MKEFDDIKGEDYKYIHTKHITTGDEENGEILFEEVNPKVPYKESHLPERIKGRWLAVGVIEDLFEDQVARNEMFNWKRSSMRSLE